MKNQLLYLSMPVLIDWALSLCRRIILWSLLPSLTDIQQRYNHIEKELLALVFDCERFHYYLYGRRFIIKTDQRSLLRLLKKPLEDLSPRIQKLTIRLLRYNFELIYVPGKQKVVAAEIPLQRKSLPTI